MEKMSTFENRDNSNNNNNHDNHNNGGDDDDDHENDIMNSAKQANRKSE